MPYPFFYTLLIHYFYCKILAYLSLFSLLHTHTHTHPEWCVYIVGLRQCLDCVSHLIFVLRSKRRIFEPGDNSAGNVWRNKTVTHRFRTKGENWASPEEGVAPFGWQLSPTAAASLPRDSCSGKGWILQGSAPESLLGVSDCGKNLPGLSRKREWQVYLKHSVIALYLSCWRCQSTYAQSRPTPK